MKNIDSLFLLKIIALLVTITCLVSCRTISTSPYKSYVLDDSKQNRKNRNSYKGVPYHLPKGILVLDIDIMREKDNTFKDISLELNPKLVPDQEHLYYLNSSENALFTAKHNISINNGMLSTLETEDEGRSGEILVNLAETGINIFKAQAGIPTQAEDESVFLTDSKDPTQEEINFALNAIPGNQLGFSFTPDTDFNESLPGISNLLVVKSKISPLNQQRIISSPPLEGNYNGIYARTLMPLKTRLSIEINSKVLKKLRKEAVKKAKAKKEKEKQKYNAEVTKLTTQISENETLYNEDKEKVESLEKKLIDLSKEKEDPNITNARLKAIESIMKDITTEINSEDRIFNKYTSWVKTKASREKSIDVVNKSITKYNQMETTLNNPDVLKGDYVIKQNSGIALLPDESRTVRIPLNRAPLGLTKNNLTLDDGVLTSYKTEKPSFVEELVDIPFRISERIVALPSEIIQLRINLTGQTAELATKQKELEDKLKDNSELEELKDEVEMQEVQQELDKLQKQQAEVERLNDELEELKAKKDILAFQKEVLVLEAEIDKLKSNSDIQRSNKNEGDMEF